MDIAERRDKILSLLNQQSYLSADEAADILAASPATIRRDFVALEKEGLVIKYFGGIKKKMILSNDINSLEDRSSFDIEEKKSIGKRAASLIKSGDLVFIEASSTVAQMIQFIPTHDIQLFTNAYYLIPELLKYGFTPFLIGGLTEINGFTYGSSVTRQIMEMNIDIAFLGVAGINDDGYLVTSNLFDLDNKKALFSSAKTCYTLACKEKFGQDSYYRYAKANEATIITSEKNSNSSKYSNIIYSE